MRELDYQSSAISSFENGERRDKPRILTLSIDSGNGHIGQALLLARDLTNRGFPTICKELNSWLGTYATSAEKKLLERLDLINRRVLTEKIARFMPPVGYQVLNMVAERFPIPTLPFSKIEEQLSELLARTIKKHNIDMAITTHPGPGRILHHAIFLGLLPKEFLAVNVACDHLITDAPIVHNVYKPNSNLDNGIKNFMIVDDSKTAEIFVARGHPASGLRVVDKRYVLTTQEQAIVKNKLNVLESICRDGKLSCGYPLIFSFVPDNFKTLPEDQAASNLVTSYAPELVRRQLVFFLLVTESNERHLQSVISRQHIPYDRAETVQTVEDLEHLLQDPQHRGRSIIFVRKFPEGLSEGLVRHVQFTEKQALLNLYSHAVVSRPSEVPRDAACFGTVSFLTTPYGPVERSMERQNQEEGISLPWAEMDRLIFSAFHRNRLRLEKHDLADPRTHQLLLKMSRKALNSPMRQPLTGIVDSILELLKSEQLFEKDNSIPGFT